MTQENLNIINLNEEDEKVTDQGNNPKEEVDENQQKDYYNTSSDNIEEKNNINELEPGEIEEPKIVQHGYIDPYAIEPYDIEEDSYSSDEQSTKFRFKPFNVELIIDNDGHLRRSLIGKKRADIKKLNMKNKLFIEEIRDIEMPTRNLIILGNHGTVENNYKRILVDNMTQLSVVELITRDLNKFTKEEDGRLFTGEFVTYSWTVNKYRALAEPVFSRQFEQSKGFHFYLGDLKTTGKAFYKVTENNRYIRYWQPINDKDVPIREILSENTARQGFADKYHRFLYNNFGLVRQILNIKDNICYLNKQISTQSDLTLTEIRRVTNRQRQYYKTGNLNLLRYLINQISSKFYIENNNLYRFDGFNKKIFENDTIKDLFFSENINLQLLKYHIQFTPKIQILVLEGNEIPKGIVYNTMGKIPCHYNMADKDDFIKFYEDYFTILNRDKSTYNLTKWLDSMVIFTKKNNYYPLKDMMKCHLPLWLEFLNILMECVFNFLIAICNTFGNIVTLPSNRLLAFDRNKDTDDYSDQIIIKFCSQTSIKKYNVDMAYPSNKDESAQNMYEAEELNMETTKELITKNLGLINPVGIVPFNNYLVTYNELATFVEIVWPY